MALTGWIASHTGLPSLMATGKEPIYAGDRLLAVPGLVRAPRPAQWWKHIKAEEKGPLLTEPRATLVSDAMAVPGSTLTYTQGDSSVTLTRPEVEWWRAMISGLDGRTIPDIVWTHDGDKRDWSSSINRFSPRIARWSLEEPARTGTGLLTLLDPDRGEDLWDLLRRSEPLIITPGRHADSLPPRFVTVDKLTSKRISGDGILEYSVTWTEVPEDSPMLCGAQSGWGAAPVVTWGEWAAHDGGAWKSRTPIELCRLIAGMP